MAKEIPLPEQPVNHNSLHLAQAAAGRYRDLLHAKADLEERLAFANAELKDYAHERLPDLMDQAGVDRLGLPAQGNLPACDLTLSPFYNANIPVAWPQQRKDEAFNALTELGHEDLIKTEIVITLPRMERRKAIRILAALEQFEVATEVRESVHWKTLTAWLKEQFEAHRNLPPLDVIGATIGRIVNLKERRQ